MINWLKTFFLKHHEVISYLFWGFLTFLVSFGSYSLLMLLFKSLSGTEVVLFGKTFPLSVAISNALSWIFAVAFAFITNKIRVFQSRNWSRKVVLPELLKFLSSRIATGILEIVGVPLLVAVGLDQTIFGIEGLLAKVFVNILVVILNYILSKFLVFRNQRK